MFHIVLHEPEIPPNTGNIMRLCVNTGTRLHLIEPLGFDLDHRQLRRAGLDYREWADVETYASLSDFVNAVSPGRIIATTTASSLLYTEVRFAPGDALLMGKESVGLDREILLSPLVDERIRIPMTAERSRSLNLANAAAIVLYEALRQNKFQGFA